MASFFTGKTFAIFYSLTCVHIVTTYEVLPGYSEYEIDPKLSFDGNKMKFALGTVRRSPESRDGLMKIPLGPPGSEQLTVPKAFYHYSERDLGADAQWGIPSNGRLMSSKTLLRNNQRDINGVYLPLPNMAPINLHFVTTKNFEKGLSTAAHDETPDGAFLRAKRICAESDDEACEKALMHFYVLKAHEKNLQKQPLQEQLLSLGDLSSDSSFKDHEGGGMGVVVGLPGYEPFYVGAALDQNNDQNFGVKFSPPR